MYRSKFLYKYYFFISHLNVSLEIRSGKKIYASIKTAWIIVILLELNGMCEIVKVKNSHRVLFSECYISQVVPHITLNLLVSSIFFLLNELEKWIKVLIFNEIDNTVCPIILFSGSRIMLLWCWINTTFSRNIICNYQPFIIHSKLQKYFF